MGSSPSSSRSSTSSVKYMTPTSGNSRSSLVTGKPGSNMGTPLVTMGDPGAMMGGDGLGDMLGVASMGSSGGAGGHGSTGSSPRSGNRTLPRSGSRTSLKSGGRVSPGKGTATRSSKIGGGMNGPAGTGLARRASSASVSAYSQPFMDTQAQFNNPYGTVSRANRRSGPVQHQSSTGKSTVYMLITTLQTCQRTTV